MKRSGLITMIVFTVLPLVLTGLAVLFVLPSAIPIHYGPSGLDAMGSKSDSFGIAFLVTACCALFTTMYAFMDKLAARFNSEAKSGRTALTFAVVWLNVIYLLALIVMAFGV